MSKDLDDIVLLSEGVMQPRVVDVEYRAIMEVYKPELIVQLQEKTVAGDYYTRIGIDKRSYDQYKENKQ